MIYNILMQRAGVADNDPLRMAGAAIAAEMTETANDRNAYHNAGHTRDVLLNTHFLVMRNQKEAGPEARLSDNDIAHLYSAAVIHDYTHDGKTNNGAMFRLEKSALQAAERHFDEYGVPASSRETLRDLVLPTDPGRPLALLKKIHDHHFSGSHAPTLESDLQDLKPLAENPRLARMAAILTDADVLSSAGLTVDYAKEQTLKLGREWGRMLDEKDTLGFITHVVGGRFTTPEAKFFQPNLDRIRKDAEQANTRRNQASKTSAEAER